MNGEMISHELISNYVAHTRGKEENATWVQFGDLFSERKLLAAYSEALFLFLFFSLSLYVIVRS